VRAEEDEPDGGLDDDDDDPLNSDDDDEEDSEDAQQTDNLVLCQYDKVARTKNKWKAQLKFGVSSPPPFNFFSRVSTRFLIRSSNFPRGDRKVLARGGDRLVQVLT